MTKLPSIPVTVQMSYPRGDGAEGVAARLRVTDSSSWGLVVELNLTPEQVTDLISATSIEMTAKIAPEQTRARLGLERISYTEKIPRDIFSNISYSDYDKIALQWAESRLQELNTKRKADGMPNWERVTVSNHNFGRQANFVRWGER